MHGVYKPGHVKLRPSVLKEIQDAVGAKYGKEKPFDLVFHGGSGSALEEIREAISYGVVKMNVDTDTQYAFTRPVAGHMFTQLRRRAQGGRRRRQQEGLRPAVLGQGRRGAMAARVKQACEDLMAAGKQPEPSATARHARPEPAGTADERGPDPCSYLPGRHRDLLPGEVHHLEPRIAEPRVPVKLRDRPAGLAYLTAPSASAIVR